MRPVSAANASHYVWGGDCDGWHLLRTPELSIIEENMPPGTWEKRHYHVRARQFFYVLAGELTMEIEREEFILRAGEGIEITPGRAHQAINRSPAATRFLVVSQPQAHGDRVEQAT